MTIALGSLFVQVGIADPESPEDEQEIRRQLAAARRFAPSRLILVRPDRAFALGERLSLNSVSLLRDMPAILDDTPFTTNGTQIFRRQDLPGDSLGLTDREVNRYSYPNVTF